MEEYNSDDLIQIYLKKLQVTRKHPTNLEADSNTSKMICYYIRSFEVHDDLNKTVHNWQKRPKSEQKDRTN